VHCVEDGPEIRRPKVQSVQALPCTHVPLYPCTHVPQSCSFPPAARVHLGAPLGSRYLTVGRIPRRSQPFLLPCKVQTLFPVRDPGPPMDGGLVYLAHGHGQRRKTLKSPMPIPIQQHRSSPSSCYNIPERSASLLCSLLHCNYYCCCCFRTQTGIANRISNPTTIHRRGCVLLLPHHLLQ
jgi:hypothetical protein